jgi:hypothetical protein
MYLLCRQIAPIDRTSYRFSLNKPTTLLILFRFSSVITVEIGDWRFVPQTEILSHANFFNLCRISILCSGFSTMTIAGWITMVIVAGSMTLLLIWSTWKVLTTPQSSEHVHPPLEHDIPEEE